jgi:hypothetical protein
LSSLLIRGAGAALAGGTDESGLKVNCGMARLNRHMGPPPVRRKLCKCRSHAACNGPILKPAIGLRLINPAGFDKTMPQAV